MDIWMRALFVPGDESMDLLTADQQLSSRIFTWNNNSIQNELNYSKYVQIDIISNIFMYYYFKVH